jgi:hypothetical protein
MESSSVVHAFTQKNAVLSGVFPLPQAEIEKMVDKLGVDVIIKPSNNRARAHL